MRLNCNQICYDLQVASELDDSEFNDTFEDDEDMDPDFLPTSMIRAKRKTTVCFHFLSIDLEFG